MRKMMKNNRMAFAASAANMFSCADSCCENYAALILDAIIMASIFVVLVSVISLISLLGLIISLLGLINLLSLISLIGLLALRSRSIPFKRSLL